MLKEILARFKFMGLLSLLAVVAFLSLGTWQMNRLAEKEALLARVAQHLDEEPINLDDLIKGGKNFEELEYSPVLVKGTLMADMSLYLMGQAHEGKLGSNLIVPIKLEQGSVILVDLGWVNKKHDIDLSTFTGDVTVQGYLKKSLRPNRFTPDNNLQTKEIYSIEPTVMAKELSLNTLLPMYVVTTKGLSNPNLIPHTPEVVIQNYHMSYAITWYGLALLWSVLFFLYIRKKVTRGSGV